MEQLSAEDFKDLVENKKVYVLDVREEYEYKIGHIRDAKLAPSTNFWEKFKELKIKKIDKIAIYCRSGARSAFVGNQLIGKGYKNIFNLEMGLLEWLDYGYKMVK